MDNEETGEMDNDWRGATGESLDRVAVEWGEPRKVETDDALRKRLSAFIKDPKSWQRRIRSAGYTGELELGAMVRTIPKSVARPAHYPEPDQSWAFIFGAYPPENPTHYRAGYVLRNEPGPYGEGASPEEALANLMIELLRK